MPYRIRWEGHGVYRRFFGPISMADFFEAHEEIARDVRYDDVRYVISDFLDAVPGPTLALRETEAFAELERHRFYDSPDIVNAAVATDEKILAHIRHFGSLKVSPYPLGIFATVAEARQWIAGNPRLGWPHVFPENSRPETASPY